MPYQYEPQSLNGKNVVLTGGTTGIGRSTAYRLVAEGANILTFGRHEQELLEALQEIQGAGPGKIQGIVADQSKPEDVERVFREADSQLGSLDILINNAALAGESIVDTDFAAWDEIVRTNLLGYMYCSRLAIDRFKTKGEGHILNVGSMSDTTRDAGSDVYVATKSGINGFTEALRKKVNEQGIKVTLIEPGLVGTDMTASKTPPAEQPQKEEQEKMLRAEEIAESIYYALTQPRRCDVVLIQIRPLRQAI